MCSLHSSHEILKTESNKNDVFSIWSQRDHFSSQFSIKKKRTKSWEAFSLFCCKSFHMTVRFLPCPNHTEPSSNAKEHCASNSNYFHGKVTTWKYSLCVSAFLDIRQQTPPKKRNYWCMFCGQPLCNSRILSIETGWKRTPNAHIVAKHQSFGFSAQRSSCLFILVHFNSGNFWTQKCLQSQGHFGMILSPEIAPGKTFSFKKKLQNAL